MAKSRYQFQKTTQPHFITATVVSWIPLCTTRAIVQILLDSLTFLQQQDRLTVYAYVILENHLHLVASSANLSKEIGDFKSFTARSIIDFLTEKQANHVLDLLQHYRLYYKIDRTYQLWQEGSHPQVIQGLDMMRQKVEYIHNNPVQRGYVDEPIHWRYSSARNYAGMEGLISVKTEW